MEGKFVGYQVKFFGYNNYELFVQKILLNQPLIIGQQKRLAKGCFTQRAKLKADFIGQVERIEVQAIKEVLGVYGSALAITAPDRRREPTVVYLQEIRG